MSCSIFIATGTLIGLIDDLEPFRCGSRRDATVLLIGGKKFDLDDFPNLRGIFKTGVGTDNLPFEEAKERGIEIELPSESTRQIIYEETANFACNLIFQCFYRNIADWKSWSKLGRDSLASKNLLVVGAGNIGGMVCKKMQAFCNVTSFDTLSNHPDELRPLMETADCISLHIPLVDSTRDFIDAEKLAWLKDGTSLVNTARGPVVNENAIYNELKTGRLFAALDVFWNEPYDGLLNELPDSRLILTPHVASTCRQFLKKTADDFRGFVAKVSAEC